MSDMLWCVHVIGPDDMYAAPDFETAQLWAVTQNRMTDDYTRARGMQDDPLWPVVHSVVALWPWTAEAHAKALPHSLLNMGLAGREPVHTFPLGTRVTKIKGSSWTGRVVGHYQTDHTPDGCCVESENEPGNVQIYNSNWLRAMGDDE